MILIQALFLKENVEFDLSIYCNKPWCCKESATINRIKPVPLFDLQYFHRIKPVPLFQFTVSLQDQSSSPFSIYSVLQGQNSSPFSIYSVFTGSNPCLFHWFTVFLKCIGNICKKFTRLTTWYLQLVFAIYIIISFLLHVLSVIFTSSLQYLLRSCKRVF